LEEWFSVVSFQLSVKDALRAGFTRYNLNTVEDSEIPMPAEPPRAARDEDEPMLYCPVCSKRLTSRKCKLFCESCGYYMSCADYY
jgi:hypothetical protein